MHIINPFFPVMRPIASGRSRRFYFNPTIPNISLFTPVTAPFCLTGFFHLGLADIRLRFGIPLLIANAHMVPLTAERRYLCIFSPLQVITGNLLLRQNMTISAPAISADLGSFLPLKPLCTGPPAVGT